LCGIYFRGCKQSSCKIEHQDSYSLGLLGHRGPDEFKEKLIAEEYSIGFCRLSIRDLENGSQPYSYKTFTSVVNGQLYNDSNIRSKLTARVPESQIPTGDMQLLAMYLIEFGLDSIIDLDGMFAGVIFNDALDELWIFRDKVGEKPLYVSEDSGHLLITSELINVPFLAKNRCELSNNELLQGFMNSSTPHGQNNVRKLKPGSYGLYNFVDKIFTMKTYWEWPHRNFSVKNDFEKNDFLNVIKNSVVSRLISDVPTTFLLSGGIDSSIVIKIAQDYLGSKQKAFTLKYQDSKYDESEKSKLIASKIGCYHEVVSFNYSEVAKKIPAIVRSMDTPILDPACISLYVLSERISSEYKVALTGDGGDESHQGYALYQGTWLINLLMKTNYVSTPILKILLTNILRTGNINAYNSWRMKAERVQDILSYPDIPFQISALSPFAGSEIFLEIAPKVDFQCAGIDTSINKFSVERYYQSEILPNVYLEKADRMSMAFGLELRSPLLAPEFIEYSAKIRQKDIDSQPQKFLLKEVANGLFGSEFFNSSKHGFSPPLPKVLRYLGVPNWRLDRVGISRDVANRVWNKALSGSQNAANASWGLYVLNSFILDDKLV
jgi:asparagine synthase (glutamine-hydrolysing)